MAFEAKSLLLVAIIEVGGQASRLLLASGLMRLRVAGDLERVEGTSSFGRCQSLRGRKFVPEGMYSSWSWHQVFLWLEIRNVKARSFIPGGGLRVESIEKEIKPKIDEPYQP